MESDGSMNGMSPDSELLRTSEDDIEITTKQIVDSGERQVRQQEPSTLAELGTENHEIKVHEGMVFKSEEEAYEKYNEYSTKIGFSVRKGRAYKRANGMVRCRFFVCYKEGFKTKDPRRINIKRHHKEKRTGCMARMVIKRAKGDEWVVSEFVSGHNHPLATRIKSYRLRSHRKIKEKASELGSVAIQPTVGFEYMTQQAVGPTNVGTTEAHYKNFLRFKRMEELGMGDACGLSNYFIRKQSENSGFFYAIMVDDENQLTNFFWADAMSIIDYNHFGDAVVFDTTYRTNKHGRAFAAFVGVNHHKQPISFGGALLIDETTESFIWLFETWMKAMSGKKPRTILTDQCASIAKAISVVLPESRHRLCLRHIYQNAATHLSHVYETHGFSQIFKDCIYNNETEENFASGWEKMLKDYDLVNNKWLSELFMVRQKWALVYGRDTFYADMTTTECSESINEFLNKFVKRKYSLKEFLTQYEKALANQRRNELEKDCESVRGMPKLLVDTRILKQAADVYTHAVYDMFENEFKEHLMYRIDYCGADGVTYDYQVSQEEAHKVSFVKFDSLNNGVVCNCGKFDSVGIICCHIIKVLYHVNLHYIPPQYISKRWTRDAKSGLVRDKGGNVVQANCNANVSLRHTEICRKALSFSMEGATSEESYSVAMDILDDGLKKVEAVVKACHNEWAVFHG